MESSGLPAELRELIARIAVLPRGLAFLHRGHLEAVAVTLGVHPFVAEAARSYLETPEGREVMVAEVRRARTAPASDPRAVARGGQPMYLDDLRDPENLIGRAKRRRSGMRFLLSSPPETVAITFGVHPFIVLRARGLLAARSRSKPSGEPGRSA